MDKPPRSPTENLVSPWTFVRWMVVGFYVGFATVAAFAFWYMYDNVLGIDLSKDGHSTVTWQQLTNYGQCSQWEKFQVCLVLTWRVMCTTCMLLTSCLVDSCLYSKRGALLCLVQLQDIETLAHSLLHLTGHCLLVLMR